MAQGTGRVGSGGWVVVGGGVCKLGPVPDLEAQPFRAPTQTGWRFSGAVQDTFSASCTPGEKPGQPEGLVFREEVKRSEAQGFPGIGVGHLDWGGERQGGKICKGNQLT